jgi:cellulose synthase/poly-beta-1,6-N-acetylglucosamine synthase-like glycosyltransferase
MILAVLLLGSPILVAFYAYVAYPLVLRVATAGRQRAPGYADPEHWPEITITVPTYNEEHNIARVLDDLLALDYPSLKRHVLVISDASTDGTDAIVRSYADRDVELLRLTTRRGKSAAENAAAARIRGSIVVNVDATVRLTRGSLKALIRPFADPTIGVVSGRDVSVGKGDTDSAIGEQGYTGYEMWIRDLETRIGSIVGASGCFYGIRAEIYDPGVPEALSRDFASPLMARECGYRAVCASEAVCEVIRAPSLRSELRRKTRTMVRGLGTLWYKRHLLSVSRHGWFAFCLASHKLARWLVFALAPVAAVGFAMLGVAAPRTAAALAGVIGLGVTLGVVGMHWPGKRVPRLFSLAGFVVAVSAAGVLAWVQALRGRSLPIWEPTRRPT